MLTEVVFASLSAIALGGGTLHRRALAVGGAFIVAGAVLAAREPGH